MFFSRPMKYASRSFSGSDTIIVGGRVGLNLRSRGKSLLEADEEENPCSRVRRSRRSCLEGGVGGCVPEEISR